ncbi:ABC transporter permease [Candidatus Woesearchaeota archaeon]|nr:ABC transporter permease [Candidatus Woesearchaeota archaeon]
MISDYLSLAVKSIRNRRLRSWLTMVGIFIGVAAVVSLISLGQGLQAAINEEFTTFGIDKVLIQAKASGFGPPGTLSAGKVTEDDIELIKKVSGVERVAGRVIKPATIIFRDEQQARSIVSIPSKPDEAELILSSRTYEILQGRMLKPSDKDKVVVGYDYAYSKLFGKPVSVGSKLEINQKKFEVVGIMSRIGDPFSDKAVLMNQDVLKELFDADNDISVIVAQVKEGEDLTLVAEDIRRAMRKDRGQKEGREDFEIQTPQQYLESFTTIINVVQAVVIGIAAISILVGGIGIMNTMYTSVRERTKEIGIMKATGARNSQVLLLFLSESGLLGLAGGTIGVILGILIGKSVERIAMQALGSELLKAYFPWYLIVGALAFSFTLGAASGIFPALQASRLKPVDALRYE